MAADISPATTDAPPLEPPRLARVPAGHRRAVRQAAIFATVGLASTLAYVVIFAFLRATWPAAVANALALILTALGNTAANRRLTFDVQGRDGLARYHAAGLLAFGVALAITSASLAALDRVAPRAGHAAEIAVLLAANALATVVRFLLLRLAIDTTRPRNAAGERLAERTHGRARLERTLR